MVMGFAHGHKKIMVFLKVLALDGGTVTALRTGAVGGLAAR